MPTPQCHNITHILGSMFQTTGDKVALATAGVLASSPFWKDYLQNANDVAVLLGPTLAGIFLIGKIVLVGTQIFKEWGQIRKTWRRKETPKDAR